MKSISQREALDWLTRWREAGHHVDDRLMKAIKTSAGLFLLTLRDQGSFMSLIWQQVRGVYLLAPPGSPRSLQDVAQRMKHLCHTFEELTSNLGYPEDQHSPEWFKTCAGIDAEFSPARFGWVAVVPATDGERKESPMGSFYIYDGVHKSLVLGRRLLDGFTYEPVGALLLLPRPQ